MFSEDSSFTDDGGRCFGTAVLQQEKRGRRTLWPAQQQMVLKSQSAPTVASGTTCAISRSLFPITFSTGLAPNLTASSINEIFKYFAKEEASWLASYAAAATMLCHHESILTAFSFHSTMAGKRHYLPSLGAIGIAVDSEKLVDHRDGCHRSDNAIGTRCAAATTAAKRRKGGYIGYHRTVGTKSVPQSPWCVIVTDKLACRSSAPG